jgi:hypothetical protein
MSIFKPNLSVSSSFYEVEDSYRTDFLSRHNDTINVTGSYIINESLYDMVIKYKSVLEKSGTENISFSGFNCESIILEGDGIQIFFSKEGGKVTQARKGIATLTITGYPNIVISLLKTLEAEYQLHQQGQLELWYSGKNGPTYMNVLINPYGTFHAEFYPWLPYGFMDEYMASTAPILFLTGEPGTGKTSILRDLICSRGLNASATYDENILSHDEMFLNFLTSEKMNLIIIEDADNILTSRETTKNNLIARFLNFSEGLAKFPAKKIIFTTNLHNFNNVDEALTRSGRCFGVLEARKLTFEEAKIASSIACVPVPTIEKEYTLSDLLHQDQKYKVKRRVTGFRN